MAAARARGALPIGSLSWINDENAQTQRHYEQEVEDFSFSARNDLDWLNEHMADVFAKDQLSFTDILKTPGKLRGKTPRTTRKRNPLEIREPLSTIFGNNAANLQPVSDSPRQSPHRTAHTFTVAEDAPTKPQTYPEKKSHVDSGYQGLSEDEVDIDPVQQAQNTDENHGKTLHPRLQISSASLGQSDDRSTTERSFHSAREDITKTGIVENVQTIVGNEEAAVPESHPEMKSQVPETLADEEHMDEDMDADSVLVASRSPSRGSSPERPLVRKSSLTFAALPAREPLTTKKSIGARTSQTTHLDHHRGSAHHSTFLGRITGGKSFGDSKTLQNEHDDDADMELEQGSTTTREESDAESKMTKLHNKSSTQRLHERINLLGKSQAHRPTKSIPTTTPGVAQPIYPELPSEVQESKTEVVPPEPHLKDQRISQDDEEEDWIQSPNSADPTRHPSVSKTILADTIEVESVKQAADNSTVYAQQRPQVGNKVSSPLPQPSMRVLETDQFRTASDSRKDSPGICSSYDGIKTFDDRGPKIADFGGSTTPIGSPMAHRHLDGTLSASKSKLQSIMKTARGLFSSSAGISAQAKMETLAASASEIKSTQLPKDQEFPGHKSKVSVQDAKLAQKISKQKPSDDHSYAISAPKTRSSTEKENRERQLQSDEGRSLYERDISAKEMYPELSNVIKSVDAEHAAPKPVRQSPRKTRDPELANPAAQESILPQAANDTVAQAQHRPQVPRTKDPKRPVRPTKDAASKPKPQPVAIRVGMPSAQRMPLSNSVLSSTLSESLPAPQKQATATKNPSLQSSVSNMSLKNSVSSNTTKPKALLAAERKREQEEKETQRKLEQKREIERRRAAQQEEARRQEQLLRQEAEKQREKERAAAAEDPRKLAQRQAIEKRRMDLSKKDQPRVPQRPLPEQPIGNARPELGGVRPPSRQHNGLDSVRPVGNQLTGHGKPGIKRVFEPEIDAAPQRPRTQGAPVYQQVEGKRRRTESEEPEEFPMRPTHAPPIRQSGMRKDGLKPSTFANNYSTAPPPAAHHHNGPPMMKSGTSSQAYQQISHQGQVLRVGNPPDMKQYMTGKIPFAEHPNPPSMQQQQQQQQPQQPSFKTPYQPKQQYATGAAPPPPPKTFSPQYPNGENIHLEDIPTDTEDDDSDADSDSASAAANAKANKASNLPEWAQSPNLHQLLETQDERMDADAVFGPVQSPHIEEMFKERQHRFRNRTSSANWAGSDRLTEEEIRRDVEARRKLRRDGGWTFGL